MAHHLDNKNMSPARAIVSVRIQNVIKEAYRFVEPNLSDIDRSRCAERCYRQLTLAFIEATTADERQTVIDYFLYVDGVFGYWFDGE